MFELFEQRFLIFTDTSVQTNNTGWTRIIMQVVKVALLYDNFICAVLLSLGYWYIYYQM